MCFLKLFLDKLTFNYVYCVLNVTKGVFFWNQSGIRIFIGIM